jgi:S-adenosylmethionine-diacylglycerol 3-amino-3-carboxypropyl transferase
MSSESNQHEAGAVIRYAQCWEDADVLLDALEIEGSDTCLSIASAGDNTLAMLSRGPKKMVAVDSNPAQIAALQLRVAAYRQLAHPELLELIGSVDSTNRAKLYQRCRPLLPSAAAEFWDARPEMIAAGIGSSGRFEQYFSTFRRRMIPLVHSQRDVEHLLAGSTRDQRIAFYEERWSNRRWKWLFSIFFSRFVMGRLGRSPEYFRYVEGSVADRILSRTRYALTELDPATNPYVQWILTEHHTPTALPFALRPENFEAIRRNLDRLEIRCCWLDDALADESLRFDALNLSDVFEYMSAEQYERLLKSIVGRCNPGARLAYWNMLVPRSRPVSLSNQLVPLTETAKALFARDKAFFYTAFQLEEVQ